MTFRILALPLLTCVFALAACGRTSSDDPTETGDDHLTSGFEIQIGGPGDAEIATVTELSDKSLLATFHVASNIAKYTPAGERDPAFKSQAPGEIWRVWNMGDGFVLAPSEHPEQHTFGVDRISRVRTSDGALDPAFGKNGVVEFAKSTVKNSTISNESEGAVAGYDAGRKKVDAVLVHEWQLMDEGRYPTLSQPQAPRTIEVMEIDAKTGASTSKGTHTLPDWTQPWTRSEEREYEQVKIHRVYPQPDGSHLLLASETVFLFKGPDNANYIATDWFTIRLVAGAAPTRSPIATGELDSALVDAKHDANGSIAVLLGGFIETFSASRHDKKVVRFDVDPSGALASSKVLVDQFPDAPVQGGFFGFKCGAMAVDGDDFVFAHTTDTDVTLTRFAPNGSKTESHLAQPARCIRTVDFGASGAIYAGMWDTTNVGWRALLTKIRR